MSTITEVPSPEMRGLAEIVNSHGRPSYELDGEAAWIITRTIYDQERSAPRYALRTEMQCFVLAITR